MLWSSGYGQGYGQGFSQGYGPSYGPGYGAVPGAPLLLPPVSPASVPPASVPMLLDPMLPSGAAAATSMTICQALHTSSRTVSTHSHQQQLELQTHHHSMSAMTNVVSLPGVAALPPGPHPGHALLTVASMCAQSASWMDAAAGTATGSMPGQGETRLGPTTTLIRNQCFGTKI